MEIEIRHDSFDRTIFTTKIGDVVSIQTILATYRGRHLHSRTADDSLVDQWVREVKKIYCKKKRQTLAVGLSAEWSDNYANGTGRSRWWYPRSKPKIVPPYELLQICVGNHSLIYELGFREFMIPKVLRDLLSDNNTIVFGFGTHGVAKKLEEDYGLKISRPWDLRRLADCYKGYHVTAGLHDLGEYNKSSKPGYYGKYSLEKLAKEILGRPWDVVKPASISWYISSTMREISDEKVKWGTVDTFLAYEMGMTFLDKYSL